jgi:hypothetical protein
MGSKRWTPRTSAQRFGAVFVGTVIVAGGLNMILMSLGIKDEFQGSISSPPIAFAVSLVVVTMILAVACFLIWFGGRLLVGGFRQTPNRKGKA